MPRTLVLIRVGDGQAALMFDESRRLVENLDVAAANRLAAGLTPSFGADGRIWDEELSGFTRIERENAAIYELPV